jgi:hypothetical protein
VGYELTTPAMSRLVGGLPASAPSSNWQQFHDFLLQRMTAKTAEDRLRYAKQFSGVLLNGEASPLQLTPDKRIHIMKALSNLSKFTGCYDKFLQIRQRYNLKWSTGTEKLDTFQRFFDDTKTPDTMLQCLRQASQTLPKRYSDFFSFSTLTGLMISECFNCIKLIKDPEKFKEYYNEERQTLEHFRHPAIFIRRTKSAYISIVDKQILEIGQNIQKTPTYNSLKVVSRRNSLSLQMKFTRKIFASYLRKSGIESELIDLLQGRVPKSVFARHYFIPTADYKDRVLVAVNKLRKEIE